MDKISLVPELEGLHHHFYGLLRVKEPQKIFAPSMSKQPTPREITNVVIFMPFTHEPSRNVVSGHEHPWYASVLYSTVIYREECVLP